MGSPRTKWHPWIQSKRWLHLGTLWYHSGRWGRGIWLSQTPWLWIKSTKVSRYISDLKSVSKTDWKSTHWTTNHGCQLMNKMVIFRLPGQLDRGILDVPNPSIEKSTKFFFKLSIISPSKKNLSRFEHLSFKFAYGAKKYFLPQFGIVWGDLL